MISRKFAYADDLALLHSSGNWKDLEGTLNQDMSTLSAYLQTWRLKLSHTKTVTAAFHLNNREAKRELKVYKNVRLLPFCPTPTYLGVKLNRSLTFRHHLVALRKSAKNYPRASHCWGDPISRSTLNNFRFGRFGFSLSFLKSMNRLTHGPGCVKAPTIWADHLGVFPLFLFYKFGWKS